MIGLGIVQLGNSSEMVGTAIPLIWSVSEQDSDQRTIEPLLGLFWQMVLWLMVRKADISYCGRLWNDN